MARLLLIRHGETELNSTLRFWGKTDVGLGPAGLRQVEQLRDRLAVEKIDVIYSSQLKRALVTAQTIAAVHNLIVVPCPELNEIDFGEIEGLNFDEVNERYPEIAKLWIERDPELVYPQGESLLQLEKRVADFRARLARHNPEDTILVTAHSGILRSLICQLLGMKIDHRWNIRIDLASLSIVETYPGTAILSLMNDTSHLTDRCTNESQE